MTTQIGSRTLLLFLICLLAGSGCTLLESRHNKLKVTHNQHKLHKKQEVVLEEPMVFVGGYVRSPREILLTNAGLSLVEAIELAGGVERTQALFTQQTGNVRQTVRSKLLQLTKEKDELTDKAAVLEEGIEQAEDEEDKKDLDVKLKQTQDRYKLIDKIFEHFVKLNRAIILNPGKSEIEKVKESRKKAVEEKESAQEALSTTPDDQAEARKKLKGTIELKEKIILELDDILEVPQESQSSTLSTNPDDLFVTLKRKSGTTTKTQYFPLSLINEEVFGRIQLYAGDFVSIINVKENDLFKRDPRFDNRSLAYLIETAKAQNIPGFSSAALAQNGIISITRKSSTGTDLIYISNQARNANNRIRNFPVRASDLVKRTHPLKLEVVQNSIIRPVIEENTKEAVARVQARQNRLLKTTANENYYDRTTRRIRNVGASVSDNLRRVVGL